MRKPTRPPEAGVALPAPLQHRLNMYARAASAAGVSALALGQSAEAKVVYTPASVTLLPGNSYSLDLNHDGKIDFVILNASCIPQNSYSCVSSVAETAKADNAGAGSHANSPFALAFRLGSKIGGPREHFYPGKALLAGIFNPGTYCSGGVFGPWRGAMNEYLGLKFKIGGQRHYGWARLSVLFSSDTNYHFQAILTGYAYETIPKKPIIAGQTKGNNAATGEPATLGRLALGRK
jgi:hypothetical protein